MKGKAKVTHLRPSLQEALQVRAALKEATDRDPQYQALRLRGLAGLIGATEEGTLRELNNLDEVAFFLSSTLHDIAEALSPDATGR